MVVGVDGSPASLAALDFAAAEADRRSEPLVVVRSWRLHAVEEDSAEPTSARIDEELSGRRRDAASAVAPLRLRYPDLPLELRFAHGDTVQSLVSTASGTGLLVLGTDDLSRNGAGESTDHAVVMRMHTALAVIPAARAGRSAAGLSPAAPATRTGRG
ncbi:Universal stress protein family protein [Rathayibacter oskolensis]|uniref:Universal stress protein family protein n=1 Tax=Rathayibacter oskolensis TaxID=1891671 RepID=A0A1X7PCP5_9MICO|nr:universal stress protein [Rathayibacter oskolensis]SMH48323.1 Universal stress protein family protein [Rathayibacter oskolensis]